MGALNSVGKKLAAFGIAALCFGYFASYVPYSMMTKMITKGLFAGMNGQGYTGFQIQPVTVFASSLCMLLFITLAGWWKHTTHSKILGISIPRPQWFTFISGLCTAVQIITTTLAYTFSGISIVFAMLLMRGGVLVMAPVVDTLSRKRKRHIFWPSWVAALLSLGALLVAFSSNAGTAMTVIAAVDIAFYLFGYFFRLLFMSSRAKSDDPVEKRRYFAEEQLTANIALFSALLIVALVGSSMAPESIPGMLWYGFVKLPYEGYFWHIFLIGTFSYGTGLFGSLIYLDKRENTFTVPANRASSVIAGVIATYALAVFYGQRYPDVQELIGVILIIGAIFFLAWRASIETRKKRVAAAASRQVRTATSEAGA